MLAYMTEVTRSSAMVREPTASIHSGDDSASSIDAINNSSGKTTMPDLSETKLRKNRKGSPASSVTMATSQHSSGDEGHELLEDKLQAVDSAGEDVPSNNNEEDSSTKTSGVNKGYDETLTRIRREAENQIERMKQESEEKSKTIAKLQMQLQQQSDYELLKREVQMLKSMAVKMPPASSLTPPPQMPQAVQVSPTAATASTTTASIVTPPTSSSNPSSLEMLLVERAKAIQQANPALKAFADMQGTAAAAAAAAAAAGGAPANFPGLGGPLRHPLFPGPAAGALDPAALGLNEEMLAQWKRSLEQGPLGGFGLPGAPLTPPTSSGIPVSSASGRKSPSSPLTGGGCQDDPPSNGRSGSPPGQDENSNISRATPSLTNGGDGSKAQSEGDSPPRSESKSPSKMDDLSPPASVSLSHFSTALSTPTPCQLTASIASHFPPLTNPMSLPLPLSVPPLMSTSRIPKSDPMEGKLQDMLRYNMEKFAGQPLDTLGMSRRVRELLSIHNIGQRLFAKYVLGLSQGTVSELLSKPKSWDKLTEKGRDSYRKMHAWAYDENAVMLLKSLIPRKGELMRPVSQGPTAAGLLMKEDRPNPPSLGPAAGFPYGQNGNEERIAKLLSEANKAMVANVAAAAASKDLPITCASSQSPVSMGGGVTTNASLTSSGEDSAQERMSKLYQEELSRLMQSQQRARLTDNKGQLPELPGLPGLFPGLTGGLFQRAQQSDLQRAMDVYHQELSRLQQNALAALRAQQNGKDANEDKAETPNPPESPVASTGDTKSPGARQESPLGKGPGSGLFPPGDVDLVGSLSPLQRMASITNSLVTQSPMPGSPQMNRPSRASLPPITQQQFDRFSHLNTDEVVRRVKDILSQYSISQRLFGESVLGLSQGSVSDLLARPKPWHMLTQKGREPFIRMKLFLDDENAVHKLVASQYKIAPEKLMRTGSYSGTSPFNQGPKQMPKLPDFPRSLPEAPILPSSLRFGQDSAAAAAAAALLDRTPPMLDPLMLHRKLLSQKMGPAAAGLLGVPTSAALGSGAPTQSLYEMAALTHEMDTQAVTTKVKEILLANNVGQKLFGEHVLGLSQGSVSELLSKPKPWHMLSIKGREPFIRMQLWLNDPTSIEKLQNVKKDGSGNGKRKRSFPGGPGSGVGDSGSDRSSPAADTPGDPYSADSPGSNSASKKQRVYFSDEQKEALRIAFALDPYPSTSSIEFLSQELGLENRSISNWFHNHRMRLKQQLPQGMDNLALLANNREGSSSAFDPVKFRLLLHQRMLEMQSPEEAAANSSSVTSLLRQFPSFLASNPSSPLGPSGLMGGLDLSYKSSRDDDMTDKDSIAESEPDESSRALLENDADSDQATLSVQPQTSLTSSSSSSRSRRKPAAPQWVRPEWNKVPENEGSMPNASSAEMAGNGSNETGDTINGVCVMNAAYSTFGKDNEDKDATSDVDDKE